MAAMTNEWITWILITAVTIMALAMVVQLCIFFAFYRTAMAAKGSADGVIAKSKMLLSTGNRAISDIKPRIMALTSSGKSLSEDVQMGVRRLTGGFQETRAHLIGKGSETGARFGEIGSHLAGSGRALAVLFDFSKVIAPILKSEAIFRALAVAFKR